MGRIPDVVKSVFGKRSWKIARFQKEAWEAYEAGESGMIYASTGAGKSYAAWMGPLIEALRTREKNAKATVLWVTPLRALAADTVRTLQESARELGLDWRVELRTGDTSSSVKARQKKHLPECLVTTPESLSLCLTYSDFQRQFGNLKCVVVDEWHELVSTKRGVQLELCLARLRALSPELRVWGLSATLGDPQRALQCLMGAKGEGRMIEAPRSKRYEIKAFIPKAMDRFPWSGHLGLSLLSEVLKRIEKANTTLVFTNTRSQAEIWFERLREAKPEWKDQFALHHGSLSRETRDAVEDGLKTGGLRCVVCTSSLDLGVDFQPVDQTMQVGSPKGISRLLQRAGRSGHRPGVASAIYCIPTNALELAEIASARVAYEEGMLEPRLPLEGALDVLAQHCVSLALADGFDERELFEEVRTCYAFRELRSDQWSWVLQFVSSGGSALKAYPQYQRIVECDGFYKGASRQIAQRHRMSVGTISSDSAVRLAWVKGGYIGSVEESFVGKLKKGDAFLFGGKLLELVRIRDMTAQVRLSKKAKRIVPRWQGGRIPLSTQLSGTLRKLLSKPAWESDSLEMRSLAPLLELQADWSELPRTGSLLVERALTREGWHLYFFPFAGLSAHDGLGNLVALRLSRRVEATFHITANDYGFELFSKQEVVLDEELVKQLFSPENWLADLLEGINEAELSKRQFRDIARIAGLVFPGYPGKGKSTRQIQVSSGLIFEVLRKYDAGNALLEQSQREVLDQQIDRGRIEMALREISKGAISLVETERLTPLAFPLWAARIRAQTVSSESWESRVRGMAEQLSQQAGKSELTV